MLDLIKIKDKKLLNEMIEKMHPADILTNLNSLDDSLVYDFYSLISEEELARIIAFLEPEEAALIIDRFNLSKQQKIINNLELDDAADILVHTKSQEDLIEHLDDSVALKQILLYEDNQVGAHMNDSLIKLIIGTDIKKATKEVIKAAGSVETLNQLFVVDEKGKFLGSISLKSLIKAKPPLLIDDLVETTPFVLDTTDIEEAIHKIQNYGLYEIAVLNNENELIGILTVDDAIDLYHMEAIDDYEKLAALPDTSEKSLVKSALKRLPWLVLLLVLSIPIALLTSQFEEVIMMVAILAFFQPLILDAGGDVATQTLAVTLRVLSKDEKKALQNGRKEILSGVINGIILGFAGFLISFLISHALNSTYPLNVSLVVGLSLTITVIIGPVFALFIPIILKKLKVDPAVASGPFITTLIDISSILIYFGLAMILLGGLF